MAASAVAQLLQRYQSENGTLPDADRLLAGVETIEYGERQAAFLEGQAHPFLYLVNAGLFKQLYLRDDGSEWIKSFAGPGHPFACPLAFAPGGVTSFASVSIVRSVAERVAWRSLEDLAERHPAWQKALRRGFQWLAERKVRRERDLLMLKPDQLYRQFLEQSPELAARVPQKDLAAYLGVTAVGLNRIVRREREAAARTD